MTALSRNLKVLAWAAALALTAALVSIAFGYPKEVSDPILGAEWRCSQTAFRTSCTRTPPAQQSLGTSSVLFRQV
jgi:hypothetical protein